MKATLITTVILTAGLMASTAQAQQRFSLDTNEYCQTLARYATAVAKEREAGYTLEYQYQDIADADMNEAAAWDVRYIAENVYLYPRVTPSEEGNAVYDICMGTD